MLCQSSAIMWQILSLVLRILGEGEMVGFGEFFCSARSVLYLRYQRKIKSVVFGRHYVDSLEYFRGLNNAMTQKQPLNPQDLMFARLALMKLGTKFYHEYNQELGELLQIKEAIKKGYFVFLRNLFALYLYTIHTLSYARQDTRKRPTTRA